MFIHLSSCKQTIIRLKRDNNTSLNKYKKHKKISYYENEQIQKEEWFKNGQYHRTGSAPAIIGTL